MFAFHRFQMSFFSNENQKTQQLGPGKVYGEILSGGKTPTVSIRENLLFYGAGVALLLAFLWLFFPYHQGVKVTCPEKRIQICLKKGNFSR